MRGTSSKASGNGGECVDFVPAAAAKRFSLDGTTTGTVMEFLRRGFDDGGGGGSGFRPELSSMAAERQRVRERKLARRGERVGEFS